MKNTTYIPLRQYYLNRKDDSPFIIKTFPYNLIIIPVNNDSYIEKNTYTEAEHEFFVKHMSNDIWGLVDWFPIEKEINCQCDAWNYHLLGKVCPHGRK